MEEAPGTSLHVLLEENYWSHIDDLAVILGMVGGHGHSSYHKRICHWVFLSIEPAFQIKFYFHAVSNVQFTSEKTYETF